jgi:hypothetical protein
VAFSSFVVPFRRKKGDLLGWEAAFNAWFGWLFEGRELQVVSYITSFLGKLDRIVY